MENPFLHRDVISTSDFNKEEVEFLIEKARGMEKIVREGSKVMGNKIMASMFLEPSTRTRLSFDAAMKRLGGNVIGFSDWNKSSFMKGETFSDTLRVIENYVDMIVLRAKYEGAAAYAAEVLDVPVINAGCGAQEHPTQAFLDLMCIMEEKGKIDGLTIGLIGDLKYGRTVHSLVPLLARYDVKLKLISPETLRVRKQDKDLLDANEVAYEEIVALEDVLPDLDVIYMTRIQRERFPSEEDYLKVRGFYILDKDTMKDAKEDVLIMHPLPRINEIAPEIDEFPQAVYFKQPRYGLYIRMALIGLITGVF